MGKPYLGFSVVGVFFQRFGGGGRGKPWAVLPPTGDKVLPKNFIFFEFLLFFTKEI